MKSPVIVAKNLTIDFQASASEFSLKEKLRLSKIFDNNKKKAAIFRAIENVSFTCFSGDKVGVEGHNGAGKSTLLRALAGVYTPSSGSIEINGKVVALLDIAMGMDSESTGYENIFIKGLMFGMKPVEIEASFDKIAAFSELGKHLSMPVRTYSSGMLLRLAFSVFSESKPDILLMDEWLSVGDSQFSSKAANRLNEMLECAKVLVLASHSKNLLDSICNRRWCIDHGKINEIFVNGV